MSLKRQNESQQQNQMPWHIFVHQIEREFEKYGKNTHKKITIKIIKKDWLAHICINACIKLPNRNKDEH